MVPNHVLYLLSYTPNYSETFFSLSYKNDNVLGWTQTNDLIDVNNVLSLCSMTVAIKTQHLVVLCGFAGFSIRCKRFIQTRVKRFLNHKALASVHGCKR